MADNNDAIIAAGINAAGQVSSSAIAAGQNKRSRKFARDMYDVQRKDALADWQMQNEYNSPGQQMARLKSAGLNANLVYGSGTVANNATAPRNSDYPQPEVTPIRFDAGAIASQYYDTKLRQAQTDNVEAATRVANQDAALRAAQIIATQNSASQTAQSTETGKFSLEQLKRLADTSAQTAEANLSKIKADTDYTLDNNERQAALSTNTLAQGAEAILRSRSDRATSEVQRRQLEEQIKNIRNDTKIKSLDIALRAMGISPQDPMYARILGRIVGKYNILGTSPETLNKANEEIRRDPNHFKKKKAPGW